MMKPLFFTVLLALLFFAHSLSAQNLTLGPQVMTFPEIAKKMSVQGKLVEYTSDLKQRAAFVSLKNRSWEETATLLSKGLQVRFVRVDGKEPAYLMRRDPRVLSRDQNWVTKFAGNIQSSMQDKLNLFAPYSALTEEQTSQKLLELQAEYNNIPENVRSVAEAGESGSPLERVDSQSVRTARNLLNSIIFLKSPTRLFCYKWLSNNVASLAEIEETIKKGDLIRCGKLNDISASALNPLIPYLKSRYPKEWRAESYDYLIGAMRFSSSSGSISFAPRISLIAPDQHPLFREFDLVRLFDLSSSMAAGLNPIDFIFEGSGSAADGKREGLGKEAVKWLANERKQTLNFLKQEKAKKIIKVDKDRLPASDLSQCIEIWSEASDSEAIMELYPQQESLGRPDGLAEFSLAGLYEPERSVWSFIESGHVLIVNNRLAFLDRWCSLPTAAYIHFERKTDKSGQKRSGLFNYDSLSAYYREVSSGSFALWTEPSQVRNYRGVNLNMLDRSLGAMCLWERLSKTERARLAREASKELSAKGYSGASVPLRRFSVGELSSLVTQLQKWGKESDQAFHPGFADSLATCTLGVSFRRSTDRSCEVRLDISPPEGSSILVWGAEASFLWSP